MSQSTEIFEQHRPSLFRLAYGMLGRVAPAEDAVQETFLRWQNQDLEQILSPKAWLSKVVNRICLDEIKSARHQKEQYVGPDLPEPILSEINDSPEEALATAESLSMALLVVLNNLTPIQRAVFLLLCNDRYFQIAGGRQKYRDSISFAAPMPFHNLCKRHIRSW